MVAIHPGGRLGEVPRYRRAELVLDVTAAPDGGKRLGPVLRTEGAGDLGDCAALLFLGTTGHGLVLVKHIAGDANGGRRVPTEAISPPGPCAWCGWRATRPSSCNGCCWRAAT